MKKLFSLLSLILLLPLFTFAQPPDTVWTMTFGGTEDDFGESVVRTADGGYVVAGHSYSFGAGSCDIYLVKTDTEGNVLWTRTFGGEEYDYGCCVQSTTDGGLIITGYTHSFGASYYDVYLIKTDANGDTMWTHTYGGEGFDEGHWVEQTDDGGYIIVGHTTTFGGCDWDVYLIKIDSLGNEMWYQVFPGYSNYWDRGYCVQQTSDGGYIIAGESAMNVYSWDMLLIKTDSNGNNIWTQTIGGFADDGGYEARQTPDGGYIATGYTWSYGAGFWDVYLVKTDGEGNVEWEKTFGGDSYDCGKSIQLTDDGGFIIAGYARSFQDVWCDGYLIKTDFLGNEEWCQTLGGHTWDDFNSIQQTPDGGYIIAGTATSFGAGGKDMWLVRLEADPEPMIFTLSPLTTPIQIPSGGGSFLFDVFIENTNAFPLDFDVWTEVILPSGETYGPLILRTDNVVPQSAIITREITQYVPGNAPAGDYLYVGNIGNYPFFTYTSDSFAFEKLAGDVAGNHHQGWAAFGWDSQGADFSSAPMELKLFPPYPNPFNPETNLTFSLPQAGEISLMVYDIQGREVARLCDGFKSAGVHEVLFDGSDLTSGVYFARLTAGEFKQTRKLMIVK